jgi:hypothetical protein
VDVVAVRCVVVVEVEVANAVVADAFVVVVAAGVDVVEVGAALDEATADVVVVVASERFVGATPSALDAANPTSIRTLSDLTVTGTTTPDSPTLRLSGPVMAL